MPAPGQPQPSAESMARVGDPQAATLDPQSQAAGETAPDLAQLQELVRAKTGRNWGELPGHLRTEILQMSQGRYRDDYARLIQLYFREIAAGRPAAEPVAAPLMDDAKKERKP